MSRISFNFISLIFVTPLSVSECRSGLTSTLFMSLAVLTDIVNPGLCSHPSSFESFVNEPLSYAGPV